MTVSSLLNRVSYLGNGATVGFAVSFPFRTQTDLVVLSTVIATGVQTVKTLTTHYTISGVTDSLGHYSAGGTVTFLVAPASTERITIYRDPSALQTLNLSENNALPAESLEAQLDYVTMLVQRAQDLTARSLRQPDGDSANITVLPSSVDRASKFAAYDGSGNPIAAAGTSANLTPVSGYINTLLDDADAPAARITLGFSDIAAKGDLLVGTANDTIGTLPVGTTTGHVPVADPSATTGISWGPRSQDNPIINGNMEVWQRGTTFAVTAPSAPFAADRWKIESSGTAGVVTVSRSTDIPTVGQAGVLFNYSLQVDVTTADAAPGAAALFNVRHTVEGYNWRHFAQRDLILSFWVKSSKTGTHCIAMRNAGADRYLIQTYTVNVADTWEFKTVVAPSSPGAGTWDYTNGTGLDIAVVLLAGSNHHGTGGSWQTGDERATSSQVNVLDNTANFFRLTGVKLELGSVATPIRFLPFNEELALCQRYYQKSFPYVITPAQGTGFDAGEQMSLAIRAGAVSHYFNSIHFATVMRITPSTFTTYNPGAANAQVRDMTASADCSAVGITNAGDRAFAIFSTTNAATAIGNRLAVHWTADAEL